MKLLPTGICCLHFQTQIFNLGANTGRISFIGTFSFVTFLLTPEDITFGTNMTVSSGTLETDGVNMTGVRVAAGALTVNSGATFNLDVPVNSNGTSSSTINSLVISGDLNANASGSYINSNAITINSGGTFSTNFNGTNQTEGWWHTTASPSSTPTLNSASTVTFGANADQVLPALTYGNLTLNAINGTRNKTIEGTGSFIVNGTFTVNSTSVTFNSNAAASSNLDFRGDIDNFGNWGTFVNDNLRLNGSSAQTISGGDPINIQNLDVEVDNSAGVTVTNNLDLDQALTITSGTLSINGADLNIAGNFTNNGGFSQTGGITIFDGSTTQQTLGSATTNFLDLTANNDINIRSNITVAGILTLDTGVGVDADGSDGSGVLTLLSTASNTASVAPLPSGASIGGDVTVQRYMQSGGEEISFDTFRLRSPVSQPAPGLGLQELCKIHFSTMKPSQDQQY